MEGDLHSSSLLDALGDNDDLKYFTALSTVVVATIQEVKDRISQIEFILSSQLFSNIELRYKALHKRLTTESRKVAEDDWRKKESSFLCQIEELQHQKAHAEKQVQHAFAALEQEKAKSTNYEQLLCVHETEKKLLLDKLEILEKNEEFAELQEKLRLKSEAAVKGKDLEEQRLHDIDLKDQELLAEKKKRKEVITEYEKLKHSYKELKSRYEVLKRMDDERNSSRHRQSQQSRAESNGVVRLAPASNEQKFDVNDKETSLLQNSNSHSNIKPHSASCSPCLEMCPDKVKVKAFAGQKYQVSDGTEMQLHQKTGSVDPPNDSLNMPMEIPRLHPNEVLKEIQDIPDPVSEVIGLDGSSDGPQDANADPPLQKQHHSIPLQENKGVKHVEPLGKKVERENDVGLKRSRPGSNVVKPQPSTRPRQVQYTGPVEPGSNWRFNQAQPKSRIEPERRWIPCHETQMQLKSRTEMEPKRRSWNEIQVQAKSEIDSGPKWRPWDDIQAQPKSGIESEAKWSPVHETQMQWKSRIESEVYWRSWNENQVQSQSRIVSEPKWRLGHGTQDANADTLPQQQHISVPVPENKGFKCVEPVRKKGEIETDAGLKRYRPVSGPHKPGSSTFSKQDQFADPIEPEFKWRSNDAQPKSRIKSETKWKPWAT